MAKSKSELYKEVSENLKKLLTANKVSDAIIAEVQKAIDASLKPGTFGGNSVDLSKVTKKDGSGKITEIQCNVSGKWLPASVDYFYEDLSGKSKIVVDGVALKRLSRQAEGIRKKFIAAQAKESQKITTQIIDGEISREEGKALLEQLATKQPDFSSVRA
mgnify:FL=1